MCQLFQDFSGDPDSCCSVLSVKDRTPCTILAQMEIHPEYHMGSTCLVENQTKIYMWRGCKHGNKERQVPATCCPVIFLDLPSPCLPDALWLKWGLQRIEWLYGASPGLSKKMVIGQTFDFCHFQGKNQLHCLKANDTASPTGLIQNDPTFTMLDKQ